MLVLLQNDFHNTSVLVKVPENGKFSKRVSKRIDKLLCGIEDCSCGTLRGEQLINLQRNDEGLWQAHKTHWRVDAASYVRGHTVWTGDYRYEWAFTAREAVDSVWANGAWLERPETEDNYTLMIARAREEEDLISCRFHTFDRYYDYD